MTLSKLKSTGHPNVKRHFSGGVILILLSISAGCADSPATENPDHVTVFDVTVNFETGELDYDPSAFDGYMGGPVTIRGLDGDGNVFHEESGENLGVAIQGIIASMDADNAEDVTVRRSP